MEMPARIVSMVRLDRMKSGWGSKVGCQGHSSTDAPSELNPLQRIPTLFKTPLVPQAKG